MIKIIISVFLTIYMIWSFVSSLFIAEDDVPKCFIITNFVNLGLVALAIIALFSLIVYNGIFG